MDGKRQFCMLGLGDIVIPSLPCDSLAYFFHPAVDGKRQFSMLGLGDIVIPGIFVAIVLRYDVAHRTKYFRR